MKKILTTLAALAVLTVVSASQALAAPHSSHSSHSSRTSSSRTSHGTSSTNRTANSGNRAVHNTNYAANRSSAANRSNGNRSYANYHLTHGTRFAHGYFYRGRNHYHWESQRFDARYGCTCFYDSSCSSWYYWCQPDDCYYPVTYCPYQTYCWGGQ
jgi:hypothetical protein